MKKRIILSVLVMFSFTLFAQSVKQSSPVLLGGSLSADFTSLQPLRMGGTADFNVLFRANKRFSVETGLEYSIRTDKSQHLDHSGHIYDYMGPQPVSYDLEGASHFVSIPVKLMVNYGKGKIRFFSGIGFSLDYNLYNINKTTTLYEDGSIDKYRGAGFTRQNQFDRYTSMLFSGIVYDMNDAWQLRSTVTLKNQTEGNFVYDAGTGKAYNNLTTLGIGVGMYYKLH